jgi:hypothetical protein
MFVVEVDGNVAVDSEPATGRRFENGRPGIEVVTIESQIAGTDVPRPLILLADT